jgi:hypothetical protein
MLALCPLAGRLVRNVSPIQVAAGDTMEDVCVARMIKLVDPPGNQAKATFAASGTNILDLRD